MEVIQNETETINQEEQMDEPKQCPIRLAVTEMDVETLPCLQERCTWWVEERRESTPEYEAMTRVHYNVKPAHCVALDWGRR